MKLKVLSSFAALTVLLAFPKPAHAIIFLPALILIPIAKLVAIIIAGLSIPALSLSAVWSKLANKSLKKSLIYALVALLIIGIIAAIILKIHNPSRPLL